MYRLDGASEVDFAGLGSLEGKAVLLNGLTDEKVYKRLIEHKASAFLTIQEKYYFSEEETSLYPRRLREHFNRNGVIPGFTITAADAVRMIGDVANAAVLPVKRGMSEDMKKELDKYFHREKEKEKSEHPE